MTRNLTNLITSTALVAAFLASIPAANWMLGNVGVQPYPDSPHMLPVWPGVLAPSAVYVVGLTLVLRDLVQRRVGKPATFLLILTGAALSALVSPALAVASGIAFLASESVDFAVFSALERRGLILAVTVSNVVSLVVDSLVFLTLAFGSLAFIEGQMIGKAWATLAAIVALAAIRYWARRQPAQIHDTHGTIAHGLGVS